MNLDFMNTVVSVLTILGAYLIVKPQQSKNEALQHAIDNNTKALEKLTDLINDLRKEQASTDTHITNIYHKIKELKNEIDEIRKCRGEKSCLKN